MTAEYYKFDIGRLPDELFSPDVPVSKWLATCETTTNEKGFPPNSLNKIDKIPLDVELERLVGIALYMFGNVLPFLIGPGILLAVLGGTYGRFLAWTVLAYFAILTSLEYFIFRPYFIRKYKQQSFLLKGHGTIRSFQYAFTERNITKYLSMHFVWPKALHRPNMQNKPMIFCVVPHGVAPIGITAYPLWSKLWNDRLCRWTTVPIVLKLPIIGMFVRKMGYIPAKTPDILHALTKREENVGIILDGIEGMFHQHPHEERAYLMRRKGIVKLALRAGAPIVPVYGFGHTSLWTVVVDPFGICEKLSQVLGASVTPFFGRWFWFLGPPRRVPITVCLGEPIECPKIEEPTQDQLDLYHQKMLDGYQQVFETHKAAYGWDDRTLKFV